MPSTDADLRGEQLRRRCAASGWLSAGGFVFTFLCSRFDRTMDSLFILGIYTLVVGMVGYITFKTLHCVHRSVQRRKSRKTNVELILLGGGIR